MEPKGYVLINHEFTATKLWPGKQLSLSEGWIDLEKIYKEALAGKLALVLDIGGPNNDSYLVQGTCEQQGDFIWSIEKADTREGSFMPIKWKFGILMPANLSPVEEFAYLANHHKKEYDAYTKNHTS